MSAVGCPLEAPPTRGDTPAENFLGLRAPRHHNVTHAGRQEGVAMLPPTQGVVDDIRPGSTGLAPTSSTNLSKRALRARPMVLTLRCLAQLGRVPQISSPQKLSSARFASLAFVPGSGRAQQLCRICDGLKW